MSEIQDNQRATDSLLYSMKPSAVSSRSYRDSIQPINGSTFASGSVIKINIPAGRRGTYLDCSQSYLKFTVDNTSGANIELGGSGCWVFINRLDVYHGSNLLESISEYSRLHQALVDVGFNAIDSNNAGMFEGSAKQAYSDAGAYAQYGLLPPPKRTGATVENAKDATYYMPIVSGVIGQLIDKYLPIGEMASDLRIEMTLNNANVACKSAGAITFNLTDVSYEASIVELDGAVQSEIDEATLGYYRIHGTSWRSYNTTLSAGVGSLSFLIPARFASLKNLLVLHQQQTISNGANGSYAICARARADMTKYHFKVGSLQVPQKEVNVFEEDVNDLCAEAYAELKKSFHSMGVLDGGLIDGNLYALTDGAGTSNGVAGSFLIGCELESFAHKNDVITAGVNTLSSNVFFEGTYDGVPTAQNVYAFAHYDMVLELQGGVMRVRQ